jgi:hypothetical protein
MQEWVFAAYKVNANKKKQKKEEEEEDENEDEAAAAANRQSPPATLYRGALSSCFSARPGSVPPSALCPVSMACDRPIASMASQSRLSVSMN